MECSLNARSSWLMLLFSSSLFLLIFCLLSLLITEGDMLKPPTVIMDLSISPFSFVNFGFIYFETLIVRYIHIRKLGILDELACFIMWWISYLVIFLGLKSTLILISHLIFLLISVCVVCIFLSFYFKTTYIIMCKVGFL